MILRRLGWLERLDTPLMARLAGTLISPYNGLVKAAEVAGKERRRREGGTMGKIVSAEEAVAIIRDGDTLCNSGFVGIGVPDELAHASLRFSFGRFTTAEEIDRAALRLGEVVSRLRSA